MLGREREDGEGLGDVGVDPVREVRRGLAVLRDDDVGPPLRLAQVGGVEDGAEVGVVVGGDHPDAVEAPRQERLEEGPPVRLGLAERAGDSQDGSPAVVADAHGDEDGAVDDGTAVAHLLVACVEYEEGHGSEWPVAPEREPLVEFLGDSADLGAGDVGAAERHQLQCGTSRTLRVETPWTYISATASLRALSLRMPRSMDWGSNSMPRALGTRS